MPELAVASALRTDEIGRLLTRAPGSHATTRPRRIGLIESIARGAYRRLIDIGLDRSGVATALMTEALARPDSALAEHTRTDYLSPRPAGRRRLLRHPRRTEHVL